MWYRTTAQSWTAYDLFLPSTCASASGQCAGRANDTRAETAAYAALDDPEIWAPVLYARARGPGEVGEKYVPWGKRMDAYLRFWE